MNETSTESRATPKPIPQAPEGAFAILEAIADPFTVIDDRWTLTYVNAAGAEMLGRKPEELVGKNLWDVAPEAVGTPFHDAYQRARRERVPVRIEEYYPPFDRWFEVNVYPMAQGLAVHSRDITARKHNEETERRLARHAALRADVTEALASHRDVRSILQHCCQSIVETLGVSFARVWTVDASEKNLELQASAGKYTHIDGGHRLVPIGKFKIGLIAEEKKPHLTNDVQHDPRVGNPEWARREKMVSFAGYPLLVDGRVVGVMAMFAQQPLPSDTLTALAGVADAIAQGIERRRAETELEERLKELARSNADLEQFAYVASHDLQEPLRMVASYNQLLARRYKGKLDSEADEFIAFSVEGVARMQQLIQDLLAYSRVTKRGREFTAVSMDKVLDAALANLARVVEDEHAVVTRDPLPEVTADEGQLVQVMQNLVSNAVKFHGDAPPKVHVSARTTDTEIVVSVADEGIGIDAQYFDRIFIIFQRLHPREKYPGTGIGLAVCKKIVERHGGRIWIESEQGKGSTVSFALPKNPRTRRAAT